MRPYVQMFYRHGGNGKNLGFGSGSGGICAIVDDDYISRRTCNKERFPSFTGIEIEKWSFVNFSMQK